MRNKIKDQWTESIAIIVALFLVAHAFDRTYTFFFEDINYWDSFWIVLLGTFTLSRLRRR